MQLLEVFKASQGLSLFPPIYAHGDGGELGLIFASLNSDGCDGHCSKTWPGSTRDASEASESCEQTKPKVNDLFDGDQAPAANDTSLCRVWIVLVPVIMASVLQLSLQLIESLWQKPEQI